MPKVKIASRGKKSLSYYHNLIKTENYSPEFTSDLLQKLYEQNPHIPPLFIYSSLGVMRGNLSNDVHMAFEKGGLAWVKDPDDRIKYLGGSLATKIDEVDEQLDSNATPKLLYNELVEKNPGQPPWTFLHMTIEQFENRLIAAFNQGEIVWLKNPDVRSKNQSERKDLHVSGTSSDSDKMDWGAKIFFVLWLVGLYYTINVSFENAHGWEYIIKCVWAILTAGIVFGMLKSGFR